MRRHDPDALTAREREVLDLLRLGLTNEEIARRLGITLDGAKYHVSQILSKLGVATREEAAAWRPEKRRGGWGRWPVWAKIGGAATVVAAIAGLAVLSWGVVRTDGSNDDADARRETLNPSSDSVAYTVEIGEVPPIVLDEVYTLIDEGELALVWVIVSCSGSDDERYEHTASTGEKSTWQIHNPHVRVWYEGREGQGRPVLSSDGTSISVSDQSLVELLNRARDSEVEITDDRQATANFCEPPESS
jgi:DNA-binding CsgD family transcriptional regulator